MREGVTEAELSKAKNGYRTQLITQQQQALNKAEALQSASLFLGDPEAVNTNWRRFLAVTGADIKRVAGYLLPSRKRPHDPHHAGGRPMTRLMRRGALLLALAAAGQPVMAQGAPKTPPPPGPLTAAPFPPFQEALLPNGVRLLVVRAESSRSCRSR